ncbi:hypothetical protein AC249_AIPGENE10071 [Exaiptasia diaphana]|nr:hypothetical protein AC249_AIPGENE10071 [Exaiptasia diaphana]
MISLDTALVRDDNDGDDDWVYCDDEVVCRVRDSYLNTNIIKENCYILRYILSSHQKKLEIRQETLSSDTKDPDFSKNSYLDKKTRKEVIDIRAKEILHMDSLSGCPDHEIVQESMEFLKYAHLAERGYVLEVDEWVSINLKRRFIKAEIAILDIVSHRYEGQTNDSPGFFEKLSRSGKIVKAAMEFLQYAHLAERGYALEVDEWVSINLEVSCLAMENV